MRIARVLSAICLLPLVLADLGPRQRLNKLLPEVFTTDRIAQASESDLDEILAVVEYLHGSSQEFGILNCALPKIRACNSEWILKMHAALGNGLEKALQQSFKENPTYSRMISSILRCENFPVAVQENNRDAVLESSTFQDALDAVCRPSNKPRDYRSNVECLRELRAPIEHATFRSEQNRHFLVCVKSALNCEGTRLCSLIERITKKRTVDESYESAEKGLRGYFASYNKFTLQMVRGYPVFQNFNPRYYEAITSREESVGLVRLALEAMAQGEFDAIKGWLMFGDCMEMLARCDSSALKVLPVPNP